MKAFKTVVNTTYIFSSSNLVNRIYSPTLAIDYHELEV